jgi:uncharacterized protein (UPF0548 family)
MFHLRKPPEQWLHRLREEHLDAPFSYPEIGCSCAAAPAGYAEDHYRIQLGNGPATFERAKQAVHQWHTHRLVWVEPCWPDARVEPGALVGTLTRVFGLYTVNVCRIVQVIDEPGPPARFGFAYGTLVGHLEQGEERFLIERDAADDSVWYDIRAVSRPGRWPTWLAYPLARRFQRRFGHDSLQSLARAVGCVSPD